MSEDHHRWRARLLVAREDGATVQRGRAGDDECARRDVRTEHGFHAAIVGGEIAREPDRRAKLFDGAHRPAPLAEVVEQPRLLGQALEVPLVQLDDPFRAVDGQPRVAHLVDGLEVENAKGDGDGEGGGAGRGEHRVAGEHPEPDADVEGGQSKARHQGWVRVGWVKLLCSIKCAPPAGKPHERRDALAAEGAGPHRAARLPSSRHPCNIRIMSDLRDLRHFIGVGLLAAASAACTPQPAGQTPASTTGQPRAVVYRQIADRGLSAYVFEPATRNANPAPVVLLLHGGGWSVGEPSWVFGAARRFAAAGLIAVPIEYRLSNDPVTPIDAIADVCAALHWVRTEAPSLGADSSRVAIYGVSAGGHLAGATATIGCGADVGRTIRGPDALVLLSPALDVSQDGHFERLLLGQAPVAAYSPVEHAQPQMPPTFIVHGERDTLTPLRGAQRFCVLVTVAGAKCELRVYSGLGHLLTRNLANQESDFDPDPDARAEGLTRQVEFLLQLWPAR